MTRGVVITQGRSVVASISLVGIVAAAHMSPKNWTTHDINAILREGDKVHDERTLNEYGWPYNNRDAKLDVDELPHNLFVTFRGKKLEASVGIMDGSVYGMPHQLFSILNDTFHSHTRLIVRIRDACLKQKKKLQEEVKARMTELQLLDEELSSDSSNTEEEQTKRK